MLPSQIITVRFCGDAICCAFAVRSLLVRLNELFIRYLFADFALSIRYLDVVEPCVCRLGSIFYSCYVSNLIYLAFTYLLISTYLPSFTHLHLSIFFMCLLLSVFFSLCSFTYLLLPIFFYLSSFIENIRLSRIAIRTISIYLYRICAIDLVNIDSRVSFYSSTK